MQSLQNRCWKKRLQICLVSKGIHREALQKTLQGIRKLGMVDRAAEDQANANTAVISTKVVNNDSPRKGHTGLGRHLRRQHWNSHLRALARACGIAWDSVWISPDWPTKDLEGLCVRTIKDSGTAGVNHLSELLEAERVILDTSEAALGGSWTPNRHNAPATRALSGEFV